MYQRHGHLKESFVNLGDKVKKGQKIGTIGNGNGQYSGASHDHADFPLKKLASWTAYVFGWTKEEVAKVYADPKPFRKICAPWFDHLGWGYLQLATYGKNKCFHPGEDWNGKGSGDSDFGLPIYSAFDGVVVYDFDDGKALNNGWGKMLVIQEIAEEVKTEEKPKIEISTPKINEVVPVPVRLESPAEPAHAYVAPEIPMQEESVSDIENKEMIENNPLQIFLSKLGDLIIKIINIWTKR